MVELSIVLVILGLLVGGVLSGQSLIRAAELRSVTAQYERYTTALQSFHDKYFALPGDMTNATAFWTAAANCPGDATHIGTGTQTCNGDGDGKVSYSAPTSLEIFRFWQHLANAGLIEGTYDGVNHGTNPTAATSANSPVGKIGSSLWYSSYIGTQSGGGGGVFDNDYGNLFEFGVVAGNADPGGAVFKPEEAWNIDTKIDDGIPGSGKVVARDDFGFSGTNCSKATSSAMVTAPYNLASTVVNCAMFFRQQY